jgi:hypothetical protein
VFIIEDAAGCEGFSGFTKTDSLYQTATLKQIKQQ